MCDVLYAELEELKRKGCFMLSRDQLPQASASAGGSSWGGGVQPERTSALLAEVSQLQVSGSSAAVALAPC